MNSNTETEVVPGEASNENFPTHSPPQRFFELRQTIQFESDLARERFINRIEAGEEVTLASVMVPIPGPGNIGFPEEVLLPIAETDIESVDMNDLDEYIGDDRVVLHIRTSDSIWRYNYETKEPEVVCSYEEFMKTQGADSN